MIKIHETMNNYSRRPNTTGLGSSFKRERGERTEQVEEMRKREPSGQRARKINYENVFQKSLSNS